MKSFTKSELNVSRYAKFIVNDSPRLSNESDD